MELTLRKSQEDVTVHSKASQAFRNLTTQPMVGYTSFCNQMLMKGWMPAGKHLFVSVNNRPAGDEYD